MAGRKGLSKAATYKEAFRYEFSYLKGLKCKTTKRAPTLIQVLRCMVLSGNYMPTAHWLTGAGGAGMNNDRAERYWRILHDPEICTVADIRSIFFYQPHYQGRQRYYDIDVAEGTDENAWLSTAPLSDILARAMRQRDLVRSATRTAPQQMQGCSPFC